MGEGKKNIESTNIESEEKGMIKPREKEKKREGGRRIEGREAGRDIYTYTYIYTHIHTYIQKRKNLWVRKR